MLTNENYFDRANQMRYMGVSQFKAFEKCEAAALAEVAGDYERERTTAPMWTRTLRGCLTCSKHAIPRYSPKKET